MMSTTNDVYELTLRTSDGCERRTLVWFPNEAVRQDYYRRATQRGLEVIEKAIDDHNV